MGSKEPPAAGGALMQLPKANNRQNLTKLLVGRSDKLEIVTPPKFGVIVTLATTVADNETDLAAESVTSRPGVSVVIFDSPIL